MGGSREGKKKIAATFLSHYFSKRGNPNYLYQEREGKNPRTILKREKKRELT